MITVSITFNRGHLADPVHVEHDEIALSLLGHCEEQRFDGNNWWLFDRRPFSRRRRSAGSTFRYVTTAVELRISRSG